MLRKLLSLLADAAIYGVGGAIGQLLGFLLLPIYTRHLTTGDYGAWGQLQLLVMVLGPLSLCGMQVALFRQYQKTKDILERRTIVGTAWWSALGTTLLVLTLALGLSPWLHACFVSEEYSLSVTQLFLVSAACQAAGAIPQAVLRSERRVKTTAACNVFKILVSMIATIVCVAGLNLGLLGAAIGSLVGDALTALLLYLVTYRSLGWRWDWQTFRTLLAFGLPFLPHHLQAILIGQFSQYTLYHLLSKEDAGLYNVAMKFTTPLSFVITAIQTAWVPFKFQVFAEDANPRDFFRSLVTYYFAAISYLWLGISLWGPEAARLMTQESFHGGIGLIAPLGLINLAQGMYFLMGTGFELGKSSKSAPLVSFFGLLAVVGSTYLLVPAFGAYGAAAATVCGWLVMSLVLFQLAQRQFRIDYDWTTITVLAVAACGLGFLGWLAQQHFTATPRVFSALGISLVYPVAVALLLYRSETERHRMQIIWDKVTHRFRTSSASKT